jgi:hypothetical protein
MPRKKNISTGRANLKPQAHSSFAQDWASLREWSSFHYPTPNNLQACSYPGARCPWLPFRS